jgi:hypothetical protein
MLHTQNHTWIKLLATAFCIFVIAGSGAIVGTATADTHNAGNSTDTNLDDSDESESDEDSGDSGDDGPVRVQAENANDATPSFVFDFGGEEDTTESLIGQIGPGIDVHEAAYNKDDETMSVVLTVKSPSGATLAYKDWHASAGRGQTYAGVYSGTASTFDLDQGTHRLELPVNTYEGKAAVTISSGLDFIDIRKQPGGGQSFLSDLLPYGYAIGAVVFAVVGVVARIGFKYKREQESGLPETADGVPVQAGTIGFRGGDDDE